VDRGPQNFGTWIIKFNVRRSIMWQTGAERRGYIGIPPNQSTLIFYVVVLSP